MSIKEDLQVREICLEVLLSVFRQEEFSHVLIKGVLDKNDDWEPGKKAFFKKLTMGVIERKTELDYVISKFCRQPIPRIRPVLLVILEMGAYQILYMDHVYDTKACNLCVELAKMKGFKNLSGFVNGVLRALAAGKDSLVYPKAEENPTQYLSVTYSFPEWMVKLFIDQYGFGKTEEILKGYLEEQKLSVHVSAALSEEEVKELVSSWEEEGIRVEECEFLPRAYTLSALNVPETAFVHPPEAGKIPVSGLKPIEGKENPMLRRLPAVKDLAGYEEGRFVVQDFASQLVGHLMPLKEDAIVVDTCASPGGKSLYIADRLRGEGKGGHVFSFDVSQNKVDKIRENAERLKPDNLTIGIWDATKENPEFLEKADVVLTDVPCSGLGVIGKKPDLKYRLIEANLESINELQKQIVKEAVKDLKEGGVLVYSTCTVNAGENEEMCAWMQANLPLKELAFRDFPAGIADCRISKGALKLLPGEHGCDGFFIALFQKY